MPKRKGTAKKKGGTAKKKGNAWIVTTSADRSIKDVAKDLRSAGFTIDKTLDAVGSIIGKGDEKVIKKLRSIRGVADVSPDKPINIGPPDSPETW
jgi:hypothetical protein